MPKKATNIQYEIIVHDKKNNLKIMRSENKNAQDIYIYGYIKSIYTENFAMSAYGYFVDQFELQDLSSAPMEYSIKTSMHIYSHKPQMILSKLNKLDIPYERIDDNWNIDVSLKPIPSNQMTEIHDRWFDVASGTDSFRFYQATKRQ